MPTIDIDMFDDAPKVGDKVRVKGEVESIDEDSGEVRISYDSVKVVDKTKKRKKNRDNDNDDDDDDDDFVEMRYETEVMPQSQSLDAALAQSFPNNQ